MTYYVDDDAPEGGDGSIAHPFNRIQDALDVSTDWDIVRVWSGIYYEIIVIDKTIQVIGNGSENTTIDGQGINDDIVRILSDGVTLSGFTIMNCDELDAGVKIKANDTVISENMVMNTDYGIHLLNVSKSVIKKNVCKNNTSFGIIIGSLACRDLQ